MELAVYQAGQELVVGVFCLFFLRFIFIHTCASICFYVPHLYADARRGQRMSDSLELEIQAVNHLMWVPGP